MIKKLLILPLLWVLGIGAFASADSVDGFSSSSDICVANISNTDYVWIASSDSNSCSEFIYNNWDPGSFYFCVDVSPVPYVIHANVSPYIDPVSVSSNTPYCFSNQFYDEDDSIGFYSDLDLVDALNVSWKLYFSKTPITYSSSSSNGSSNGVLWSLSIPSSFTSGLTSLVNNFGSTIVWRLPTVILVALWITAIFSLFRLVRRYSKSAFKW